MNILISIVLVQFIGLIGVVIGTLITDIYIWVIRSYQVVRQYFHEQIGMYALKMVKYCVLTAISIIICVVLCHIINIENMLIGLVVEVIVSVLVSVIINLLFTWNSDEFNKCKEILIRYLRRS